MARPTTVNDESIFQAVRTVMAGQPRLTTARVAEVAGVSEGLIFKRYRSKSGLLTAVMEDALRRLIATIDAAGAAPYDVAWVSTLASEVLGHIRFFVPMALAHMGEPLDAPHLQVEDPPPMRVVRAMANAIGAQMARGHLRDSDPSVVARAFIGALWQYAFEETLMRARGRTHHHSPDHFVVSLAAFFWEGLAPASHGDPE